MGVLSGLRPEAPLKYFEEICAIPHGSCDTKRISDYCVAFAKAHGLRYIQDVWNNVVIYKDATAGYETHPTVILQGHLDMVCEKDADCDIDFSKDGLRLRQDGKFIFAEGTTLGGDDGIAVAYALAVLAAEDLRHPAIEAVFTVDEEIGMIGANAMDMSVLQGRVLLNCDSEDEGILTVSCAGGATSRLTRPITRAAAEGTVWHIAVTGLLGGHSGVEIHKGRANANRIMGKLLDGMPVRLVSVNGGSKDNAIPRACEAVVISEAPELPTLLAARAEALKRTLPETETAASFSWKESRTDRVPMNREATEAVIGLLCELPNGVQSMSEDIAGLVQTSLNLGILKTEKDIVTMTFSVRSSVNSEKQALIERLKEIGKKYAAKYTESGAYPAWEYRKDSRLRRIMVETYAALYGKEPVVEAIHAGLECGIFSDRLEGLDAVSFGPQMHDIHTSRERLEIDSVARTWEYLVAILQRL